MNLVKSVLYEVQIQLRHFVLIHFILLQFFIMALTFKHCTQFLKIGARRYTTGILTKVHSTNAQIYRISKNFNCTHAQVPSSTEVTVISSNSQAASDVAKGFSLVDDFITKEEEQELYNEVHPYLRKLRYEFDHWDNAIQGYRETERQTWSESNKKIIQRIRSFAFSDTVQHLEHVHVLDLSKDGHIKPHVDSVRFCGSTIAGVSLLSSCVFKLVHTKDDKMYAHCLVKPRSLYIMTDVIRYDYTHEVLANEQSIYNGEHVEKDRRISIICRSEPNAKDNE